MIKKVALITGASRGIGFAIARRLGSDGFRLALVATSDIEKNRANLNILDEDKIEWFYIQADISSSSDREKIVKETLNKYGRIDVLVNNAGVAPKNRADLLEMTEESFDRVISINTKGNMFLTQKVAKVMIEQEKLFKKKGTIINISSCSAEVSSISRGEYCISKAGVSMLTTLSADRLAKEGILVHEIRPGVIATDMTEVVTDKYDKLIKDGLFPIARWGQPEDIANAVSAFADDHFLYTTGNYIDVDGGFHIKRL